MEEGIAFIYAVIIVAIAALFWRYVLGINFISGYGIREKRNAKLEDLFRGINPERYLFVCEGCGFYLGNDKKFPEWIRKIARKNVYVKILLADKESYNLENLENVNLYRINEKEKTEIGFVLADRDKNHTAFIQKGLKISLPRILFPGVKKELFAKFDKLCESADEL